MIYNQTTVNLVQTQITKFYNRPQFTSLAPSCHCNPSTSLLPQVPVLDNQIPGQCQPVRQIVKVGHTTVNEVLGYFSKMGLCSDDDVASYYNSNHDFIVEIIKSIHKQKWRDANIPGPYQEIDLGW